VLLQFSSNFAQGPFQGYVPDLVPARQVGTASGLMGMMIIGGQIAGVAIAIIGVAQLSGNPFPRGTPEAGEFARQAFFLPTIALGLIELLTMIPLVLFVSEGRQAPPRSGRSLWRIGLGAWGTDILRERSYVWLLVSRLFFLMAPSVVIFLGLFYLRQALGTPEEMAAERLTIIVAVMGVLTGLATLPAARLSDRIGRKNTIYLSIAVGICGMAGIAVAPSFEYTVAALVLVGISAGAFLAVDWALMTDIIPKANAGRYMGISAVATGASGPFSRLLAGPLLTLLVLAGLPPELRGIPEAASQSTMYELAPRIVMAVPIIYLLIAALALTKVDERRRED
jgi:MFS family permease